MHVPVKGRYLQTSSSFSNVGSSINIVGTDAVLPTIVDGGARVLTASGAVVTNFTWDGNILVADGWNGLGGFVFQSMGNKLHIAITNPGAAGQIVLGPEWLGKRVGLINVPGGGDVYQSFDLPNVGNYSMAAVAGGMNPNVTWRWTNS
jgi:hypothetical protein